MKPLYNFNELFLAPNSVELIWVSLGGRASAATHSGGPAFVFVAVRFWVLSVCDILGGACYGPAHRCRPAYDQ
jgi:hypothetical protein